MSDFIKQQIEAQERLYQMMQEDFHEKDRYIQNLEATIKGLILRIQRRDKLISELRESLKQPL